MRTALLTIALSFTTVAEGRAGGGRSIGRSYSRPAYRAPPPRPPPRPVIVHRPVYKQEIEHKTVIINQHKPNSMMPLLGAAAVGAAAGYIVAQPDTANAQAPVAAAPSIRPVMGLQCTLVNYSWRPCVALREAQ